MLFTYFPPTLSSQAPPLQYLPDGTHIAHYSRPTSKSYSELNASASAEMLNIRQPSTDSYMSHTQPHTQHTQQYNAPHTPPKHSAAQLAQQMELQMQQQMEQQSYSYGSPSQQNRRSVNRDQTNNVAANTAAIATVNVTAHSESRDSPLALPALVPVILSLTEANLQHTTAVNAQLTALGYSSPQHNTNGE